MQMGEDGCQEVGKRLSGAAYDEQWSGSWQEWSGASRVRRLSFAALSFNGQTIVRRFNK